MHDTSDQAGLGANTPRHYNPTIVKQHIAPGTEHRIYRFENGYGASVIPEYNYIDTLGNKAVIPDCLELAVLKYTGEGDVHDDKNWSLCYDSPITSDTLRRLTPVEVDELLDRIAAL